MTKQTIAELIDGLDWQPIESAPKDGSKVIITDGLAETWIAYWSKK